VDVPRSRKILAGLLAAALAIAVGWIVERRSAPPPPPLPPGQIP
jgi:hypothetical protein